MTDLILLATTAALALATWGLAKLLARI